MSTIAIVGASLAGAAAADAARRSGFEGEILLIGDEGVAPYERPPLSKGLLRGETEPGDTAVFENDHYSELGVELRRTGALEFGLHFGQRPKGREELVNQFPFARLRLKHDHDLDSLCSKYPHNAEYST